MIIGLEWICFLLLFVALVSIVLARFTSDTSGGLSVSMAVLSVLSLVGAIGLFGGLKSAQDNVQKHYVEYLKLQTQVAQYDDLDVLEQYKVRDDVMTYNLWYERNKSDLETEWSLKGTSTYAKEFDFPQEFVEVLIGG
jgi:type II secretory pathway pseudopilin PulG